MAFQKTLFVVLLGFTFAYSIPIPLEDLSEPMTQSRELPQDPSISGYAFADENLPNMYFILLQGSPYDPQSLLSGESADLDSLDRQERDVEDQQADDLETAAGTNVLRPLFVYRQQIAYRQRLRNERRRRYRL